MSDLIKTTEIYALLMSPNDNNFFIPHDRLPIKLGLSKIELDKIYLKSKSQANIIGFVFTSQKKISDITDLNKIGVSAAILSRFDRDPLHYLCGLETLKRFEIIDILEIDGKLLKLKITEQETHVDRNNEEIKDLCNIINSLVNEIAKHNNYLFEKNETIRTDLLANFNSEKDPVKVADKAVRLCCPVKYYAKSDNNSIFQVLTTVNITERLELVTKLLSERIRMLGKFASIVDDINERNRKKSEALVMAQYLVALKDKVNETDPDKKLGDMVMGASGNKSGHSCSSCPGTEPKDVYKQRLEDIKPHISQKTYDIFLEKINEMANLDPKQSEYPRKEEQLKRILMKIPWEVKTKDNPDLNRVEKILDRDHYGMEETKKRILEYAAVVNLNEKGGGIVLLSGPPGVGKTSIGKGIAEALGRKFHRTSVGGARDESIIKGFLPTYVGAKYGMIVNGLMLSGSMNPVFMIDEVDKMSSDSHRGDPTSALLEVLDKEINHEFYDYYFEEIPIDLSGVLFILTANYLNNVPPPLLDRLESIEQSSYTTEEKIKIGEKHLLKRALLKIGLIKNDILKLKLEDGTIKELVTKYVAEAGVRELERTIEKLCRRFAVKMIKGKITEFPHTIKKEELIDYLGIPKRRPDMAPLEMKPGVSLGMAYTEVGGCILFIETTPFSGTGKIKITGRIKEVMQESVHTALTSIKKIQEKYKIEDLNKKDIHIHIPAGSIPKEGPSAGIAIATSIISALTEKSMKPFISMTGELTSHGKVTAIGGVREKCISAANAGIKTIILPEDNKVNWQQEVPDSVKEKVEFIFVKNLEEVIEKVF